jgi:hypothetical protein
MSGEIEKGPNIFEKISPRDKEVILLAPLFFWEKYMRRNGNSADFKPNILKFDPNDPISILKSGFDLHRQLNDDIDGDIVKAFSESLARHPMRIKLFPSLDDSDVKHVCTVLDMIFENQEFCAQSEGWSLYNSDPEEFALGVANSMLYFEGSKIRLSWFEKINKAEDRQLIVERVLKEKLGNKAIGLLSSGENMNT